MAAPTLEDLHEAKKTALAVVNLFRHCGGMAEAFDVAIGLKDEQERLLKAVDTAKRTLATTTKKQEEAEAAVQAMTQQHQALNTVIAAEYAEQRLAVQRHLEAETEAERQRLAGTYAQLEADVALLDGLKAALRIEVDALEAKVAEREGTLRSVQAQLQAMLVGGTA